MMELGAVLLASPALAHLAIAAIAGRRVLLEIGLTKYDAARHRLYWRREGDGPAVLFVHGLCGSWRYWRRGLDGIRAQHTAYLADLVGFGRSPKPRGDYSLGMHLDALAPLAGMPVDLYRDYWKHTWASVSRSLFNTLLASDVAGLFEAVDRSRITLIYGRHDLVAPLAHIRGLLERFPDLTLKELRGDHHLYLMYPRLLNRLITERSSATEPERS
jgi:pimeloyl-ACP methyl ester carboxylesterase